MKEIRKDLSFNPDYEISNYGYIVSKPRKTWNGRVWANKKETVLKANYYGVSIDKKFYNILDLLAEYFLECPKDFSREFYEVTFADGDKTNWRVDNLKLELKDNAMRVYDMEGNWLEDISSPSAFTEKHGIPINNAYRCARGLVTHDSGFQFRLLKDGLMINKLYSLPSLVGKRRSDTTPVAKYWGNKLICVYNSITEASEANEMDVKRIWESYERNKPVKGFLFKKIE